MKTYNDWEKSNIDLDKYLGEIPCEIDEGLFNYVGEAVAPLFIYDGFAQCGEVEFTKGEREDMISYHITCRIIEDKYYYLGILPEFQQ